MGVSGGANAHFTESVYELCNRMSHRFSPSLPHVWVTKYRYKVLEGTLRERIRTIIRQVCKEGRFVQRACTHVRRDTTAYRGQRRRSTCQRALVASRSDGVPRTSQTLLGSPFLGEGLLLHYQRQHHRRGDTSVSQVS